jgi:phage terminase small subunit
MAATTLTAKQQAFCIEYLKDRNGTQAAIRAGYSEASAKEQAAKLMRHPLVKEQIGLQTAEVAEAAKVTLGLSFARLEEAYLIAKAKNNSGGIVQAVMAAADLAGLTVKRHEDVVERERLELERERLLADKEAADWITPALASYDLPATATPAQLIGAASQTPIVTPELFRVMHVQAKQRKPAKDSDEQQPD